MLFLVEIRRPFVSRARSIRRISKFLFLIIFLSIFFLLSPAGHARVITSYMLRQWGDEILTQIEADFGRMDGLYNNSTTQLFPDYAWGQGVMLSANVAASKMDRSRLSRTEQQAQAIYDQYRCYLNGIWGCNAGANACGDRYYDDNAWLALAYMELYEVTGNSTYIAWAQEIVAFCMSGENGPGDTPDGGIRWHEPGGSYDPCGGSVAATAPTCLANLLIYRATGTAHYLTDGIRLYDWLKTSGVQDASGLYHQGINCDGSVNYGYRAYQTAVPLQAALRLYQITGDTGYLDEARRLATAMEVFWINRETYALGEIGYWGGHDMTNAYVDLYEVDHSPHWLNVAAGYLAYLYDNCKVNGRYPDSWNETNGTPSSGLLANASVARAYWKMATAPGGRTPVYPQYIRSRSAGKCLRPYNAGTSENTNVTIYTESSGDASERWSVMDLGNGYYNILNWNAKKSIQPVNQQGTNNTITVISTTNPDLIAQQWSLIDLGSGYYNIQNRLTRLSLQPYNSGTADNTTVVTYQTNLTQSQQWAFINSPVPSPITPYISTNGFDWHQTNHAVLDAGNTISLKAQAAGSGTWRWDGPGGFSSSGSEVTVSGIQAHEAGYYIAIYTNGYGAESFASFDIAVTDPVKLYQHCDYGGWAAEFGAGAYTAAEITAAGGLNNDASSVKIDPGFTVTFYDGDNFTGASLVKIADDTCLVDEGWNDQITSLVIEGRPAPIAHWPFNDNGGSVTVDASGNGHNGTLINMDSTSWTAGKQCGGLAFGGSDDYLEVSGFMGISGSAGRTCSAWIRTTHASGEIISWGSNDFVAKWIVRINEDGTLRAEINGGYIYGTTYLLDNQWHHVTVVLEDDGSTDISEAMLYVDGTLETIGQIVNRPVNTAADYDVHVGVFLPSLRYFQGLMDEVRIYDRTLSGAEIHNLYQMHALVADTEPDGDVDLNDFAVLADSWQNSETCDGDLTCDCTVDIDDLMFMADEWLKQLSQ